MNQCQIACGEEESGVRFLECDSFEPTYEEWVDAFKNMHNGLEKSELLYETLERKLFKTLSKKESLQKELDFNKSYKRLNELEKTKINLKNQVKSLQIMLDTLMYDRDNLDNVPTSLGGNHVKHGLGFHPKEKPGHYKNFFAKASFTTLFTQKTDCLNPSFPKKNPLTNSLLKCSYCERSGHSAKICLVQRDKISSTKQVWVVKGTNVPKAKTTPMGPKRVVVNSKVPMQTLNQCFKNRTGSDGRTVKIGNWSLKRPD